jgi:Ca2+-binding EF-hand superfamily protein
MRGFILTTKGDLKSKIDYTFRIYDQNGDNQISGEEIKKMANVKEKIREIKFYLFILGYCKNVRW